MLQYSEHLAGVSLKVVRLSGRGQDFCTFFLFGMIAFAAYDGIRVVRRIFPHGIFYDFLRGSGILDGHFALFLHLCQVNNGKIRGYVLLGSLLGAWIYYSFCSRFVMRYLTEKIHYLKKRLKKVPGNDYNKVK